MTSKIMNNADLVIQDNNVFGFSLNTLISDNAAMKEMRDLSVPAGLFLINSSRTTSNYADFIKKGDAIGDSLYESLISAAEPKTSSNKKKTKRAKSSFSKKTRRR